MRPGLLRPAPDGGDAGVQAGAAGRFRDRQLHCSSHCRNGHVWLVDVR